MNTCHLIISASSIKYTVLLNARLLKSPTQKLISTWWASLSLWHQENVTLGKSRPFFQYIRPSCCSVFLFSFSRKYRWLTPPSGYSSSSRGESFTSTKRFPSYNITPRRMETRTFSGKAIFAQMLIIFVSSGRQIGFGRQFCYVWTRLCSTGKLDESRRLASVVISFKRRKKFSSWAGLFFAVFFFFFVRVF